MEVIHERCAGLDVHKDTVVAAVRKAIGGKAETAVRTFGTTTGELLSLGEWLSSEGCTHVAMESTGVYWKPVWHVLEDSFALVLANAGHVRNVPGRKSDVSDAVWLADLLAHGLIRGSFVPPRHVQEIRDLTRTRKQLVREIGQHTQRLQKVLEDANIKLDSVISNVLGRSGRSMLRALIDGESSAEELASMAHPRLRAKPEDLVEALRGRVTEHHRFMLKLHLEQAEHLEAAVATLEKRLGELLVPFQQAAERLTTIPGVSHTAAHVIVSEIGFDMTRFPTAGHLVSWAGLCPRMDESAGKRRSTRIRQGAPWLKTTLVTCAWAASRTKNTYARAQFQRLRARRGAKKAAVAVAASLLTSAYHMLKNETVYNDLGAQHFDRADKAKVARRLTKRLEDLGYVVDLRAA